MEHAIDSILRDYEQGMISRRELVCRLCFLGAAAGVASPPGWAAEEHSFSAIGINHLALRVTDVPRAREFYTKHLGMQVARDDSSSSFLTFENGFLALFRGEPAGLHHFCFSVKDYNVVEAEKTLKSLGFEPDQPRGTNRIYFKDPDGLTVQLAAPEHRP
jgi:catechol 2,3-dioxygenase-like lactoylglutathione lyase family enzyme